MYIFIFVLFSTFFYRNCKNEQLDSFLYIWKFQLEHFVYFFKGKFRSAEEIHHVFKLKNSPFNNPNSNIDKIIMIMMFSIRRAALPYTWVSWRTACAPAVGHVGPTRPLGEGRTGFPLRPRQRPGSSGGDDFSSLDDNEMMWSPLTHTRYSCVSRD